MRERVSILILSLGLSPLLLSLLAHSDIPDVLRASFIDVGEGDSIRSRGSDDTDILINGGRRSAGPTVVVRLQAEGVDDIAVMVLSPVDADYYTACHQHIDRITHAYEHPHSDQYSRPNGCTFTGDYRRCRDHAHVL